MTLSILIGSILALAWCVLVAAIFYSAGDTPSFMASNQEVDDFSARKLSSGFNERKGSEMPVESNGDHRYCLPDARHSCAENTLAPGSVSPLVDSLAEPPEQPNCFRSEPIQLRGESDRQRNDSAVAVRTAREILTAPTTLPAALSRKFLDFKPDWKVSRQQETRLDRIYNGMAKWLARLSIKAQVNANPARISQTQTPRPKTSRAN